MSHVTLVMSRVPLEEFKFGGRSGRWGNMVMVEGPRVRSAQFMESFQRGVVTIGAAIGHAAGQNVGAESLELGSRPVTLITDGGTITNVTPFDTMERFKSDSGKGFYMQTKPRPMNPYKLTMFRSSTVAELNGTGECLRVHGHGYKKQGTNQEAGILVHEAPHVGWLIGCISPRPKNVRKAVNYDKGPSHQAMETIFAAMGGFKLGTEASLIVMDW